MKQIFFLIIVMLTSNKAFFQTLTRNQTISLGSHYLSIKTAIYDLNVKGAGRVGVAVLLPARYTYTNICFGCSKHRFYAKCYRS